MADTNLIAAKCHAHILSDDLLCAFWADTEERRAHHMKSARERFSQLEAAMAIILAAPAASPDAALQAAVSESDAAQ